MTTVSIQLPCRVSAALPAASVEADQPFLTATAAFPAVTASAGTGTTITVFGGVPVTTSFPAPVVRQDASITPATLALTVGQAVVALGPAR